MNNNVDEANTFADNFVEGLKNGEYEAPTCPDIGRKVEFTDEFIKQEVERFDKLMDSPIIKEACDFPKVIKKEYNKN